MHSFLETYWSTQRSWSLLGESFGGLYDITLDQRLYCYLWEIIPRAACHCYAIQSARAVPIVKVFQFFIPLSIPAMVLDKILGQDLGQILDHGRRAFILVRQDGRIRR